MGKALGRPKRRWFATLLGMGGTTKQLDGRYAVDFTVLLDQDPTRMIVTTITAATARALSRTLAEAAENVDSLNREIEMRDEGYV